MLCCHTHNYVTVIQPRPRRELPSTIYLQLTAVYVPLRPNTCTNLAGSSQFLLDNSTCLLADEGTGLAIQGEVPLSEHGGQLPGHC